MNAAQPEFLATLVVSFPQGEERLRAQFPGWEPLGVSGLMQEMELFLSQLELKRTVFRSDHASNWLMLKGTLGADKPRLLQRIARGHRRAGGRAAAARLGARPLEAAEAPVSNAVASRVLRYREHRTGSLAHDALCRAPPQIIEEIVMTGGGHDDQIGPRLRRDLENCFHYGTAFEIDIGQHIAEGR